MTPQLPAPYLGMPFREEYCLGRPRPPALRKDKDNKEIVCEECQWSWEIC